MAEQFQHGWRDPRPPIGNELRQDWPVVRTPDELRQRACRYVCSVAVGEDREQEVQDARMLLDVLGLVAAASEA